MLQSAIANFPTRPRRKILVYLSFRSLIISVFLLLAFVAAAIAQTETVQDNEPKPTPKPITAETSKDKSATLTAEQIVETSIVTYAFPTGRVRMDQIRKTASERGTLKIMNADGKLDTATYQRWALRGEDSSKEKIRLDQQYATANYALIRSDEKTFGIYNNSVFVPREDAAKAFENRTIHGLDAFLRYKENGSTIELAGREKKLGVEFYQIDVTDKGGSKTRFYVSVKTFRVMMLEYEENGLKYLRKFYDYNYAQGTLFPFHSVLYADGKIVEEVEVGTVTFGQKVDESLFARKEN